MSRRIHRKRKYVNNKIIEKDKQPIIETLINTAALALTAYGVQQITIGSPNFPLGYLSLIFGMSLEFFKYWGRNKSLW